jgi:hypothetical protein
MVVSQLTDGIAEGIEVGIAFSVIRLRRLDLE